MPLSSHIALENIPAGQAYCSCLFAWRRPSKSIYFCIFTPAGKAMFQILHILPSSKKRVRADLARATETAVRATLANGTGVMKAAKMHGDGVVHRDAHLPSSSVKAPRKGCTRPH